MKIVRLHLFCCAKGFVREKLAKCDRGMLLFGSDMQKGSFFNLVSDHGGVSFRDYNPWAPTSDISLDIRARDDHLLPLTSNHVS